LNIEGRKYDITFQIRKESLEIAKDRFQYSKERYKYDLAKTKGRI
jgi:hypothetical protein